MSQRPLMKRSKGENLNSRCTIRGKVCGPIIDGGSSTNVASNTLIDKLQILTKKHPTPYSLWWLGPKDEVIASRQALISLSIGPYCGEVLCDVLPIDACHLPFSRPWLFDNHVIYDGHANTYSLKHNGYSLTLTPIPHLNLSQLNRGRKERKASIKVKHRMKVPLVRANLNLYYPWSNQTHK